MKKKDPIIKESQDLIKNGHSMTWGQFLIKQGEVVSESTRLWGHPVIWRQIYDKK